nr:12630_t:CDS:2 [Entrophospora candida]
MSEKDLSSYLKENGFIIPNAEIYGGLAKSPYNVGVDSQIITHPQVLTASGHLKEFYDWAVECSKCRKFYRLDKILSEKDYSDYLKLNEEDKYSYKMPERCPGCGKEINKSPQKRSTHRKLPFGVGQIGKSFRNEITLRHDLVKEELPHYAKKTKDFYFSYHFGWGEICSNSHRGNYDLTQHSDHSSEFLGVKIRENNEDKEQKIIPQVIEVSFGVERLMLAVLEDAYREEIVTSSQLTREVLRLHPLLAPYFVAVIPSRDSLRKKSYELYCELLKNPLFSVAYEETGSIGNRYRRQDAIGTYYCLTVDTLTVSEFIDDKSNPDYNTVTLRHRDTMKQEEKRINIAKEENKI